MEQSDDRLMLDKLMAAYEKVLVTGYEIKEDGNLDHLYKAPLESF